MSRATSKPDPQKRQIRCAIYTRKSSEEGLEQEFNSLDAQRESAEAYIVAQKHEGWICLPHRYDDGGFSGGNIDRPALTRLLKDIEYGKVDCVVVYKVDRLSRSLMDFSRIVQTFEKHNVSFVSVTQQFNTTHSMGRLTLNILLSFAQFEREIISERTRDKIAAARRKGKYIGGRPVLGYDVDSSPSGGRLVVNEEEAVRVRAIYQLYIKHESLIPTVTELNRRGWRTKRWQSSKGNVGGDRPFDKCSLFNLLTNMLYLGKVAYKDEVHEGEHQAIVDQKLWQKVQAILQRNGRGGGGAVRNRHGALLKGLLRCSCCDCSMGHTYSSKGSRKYRYYVCLNAQKRGWNTCPAKSVPAGEIEKFVVEQIKCIGRDPNVLAQTIRQVKEQGRQALAELEAEGRGLAKDLARFQAEMKRLAPKENAEAAAAMVHLHERMAESQRRMTAVKEQILALGQREVDQREIQLALAEFDPLWQSLTPKEQERILRLLVEKVEYDGKEETVSITFHPNGIKTLAQEQAREEAA